MLSPIDFIVIDIILANWFSKYLTLRQTISHNIQLIDKIK